MQKCIGLSRSDYDRLKNKLSELGRFNFKNANMEDVFSHHNITIRGTGYYYIGQCFSNSDVKHGLGLTIWATGDCYEGFMNRDMAHGRGRHIYSNGNVYEGEYQACKKHGFGTMTYADGSKYVGNWAKGRKHGEGTFYDADGNETKGKW